MAGPSLKASANCGSAASHFERAEISVGTIWYSCIRSSMNCYGKVRCLRNYRPTHWYTSPTHHRSRCKEPQASPMLPFPHRLYDEWTALTCARSGLVCAFRGEIVL